MTGGQLSNRYSDETSLVKLYPPQNHKEAWRNEAEERGTSMSQYCQELIQEARFLREQGQLKVGDRRQVEKLREDVETLETQLEHQSPTSVNHSIVSEELVKEVFTDNYRSLDDLLEALLANTAFRQQIRTELEKHLYELGNCGEAAFRRGWGWKRIEGDDDYSNN